MAQWTSGKMSDHSCESAKKSPLRKHCTEKDIQMAYKHGKMLIDINSSENCKLTPTIKYDFIVIRQKFKSCQYHVREGYEAKETILIAGGSIN